MKEIDRAFFNICSLIIDAETLPQSYQPFLVNGIDSIKADLTIRRVEKKMDFGFFSKVIELPYMNIWKSNIIDSETHWLFEARNGMCMVSVDKNYNRAEYWYSNVLSFLDEEEIRDVLSPYYQVVLECKLVQRGISILHSSCIAIDGNAYAFVGPSGVGKSTRAKKWCELLSAEFISGDRPAIDTKKRIVYGVPWDGKEKIYKNVSFPLACLFKIIRSKTTRIERMKDADKLQLLCEQSFIPLWDTELAANSIYYFKRLINSVPIFQLYCDITDESTYSAYAIAKGLLLK